MREAGNAAAARDAVERVTPDALLVDVGLPDGRASVAQGFVLKSCLAAAPLERFLRTPSP